MHKAYMQLTIRNDAANIAGNIDFVRRICVAICKECNQPSGANRPSGKHNSTRFRYILFHNQVFDKLANRVRLILEETDQGFPALSGILFGVLQQLKLLV